MVGMRSFNHFVTFAVINGEFDITDGKVLSSAIRASFTICTSRKQLTYMLKIEVGKRWCEWGFQLNLNRELINKTGMINTITHFANKYTVCVNNYLVYGLRDQYMRLLKRLKVVDYNNVGLKVLEHFVEQRSSNFSSELSSADITFMKNKGENTKVNEKIDVEKKFMPKIMPYNSAFVFLSRVRDKFHGMKGQTKKYVVPLSSTTPTFIRLDKAGLQHSMAVFCVHLPNQIKPKRQERIADVIEWHPQRNHDLDQSFQTDGAQVILNYIEIVEVEKNGIE